ncbi:MAG: hypothetical protein ACW98K_15155 [Candidatus Kariarchaeaceae archaeon]|jgi:hypothetical protein
MVDVFYSVILGIGLFYFVIALFSDLEFLMGTFSLGLPYGLLGWGILGLLDSGEPFAFGIGFLFPFLAISAMYTYTTSSGKILEEFLFKEGIVTIPITPKKKGEIKVSSRNSNEFLIATAENISKPIPKGENVRIIDIEGVIAQVTTDLSTIKTINRRSTLYNSIFRVIQFLAPRPSISGICMVCYAGLIRSKQGIKCPNCNQVAHKEHIRDWLLIKQTCPNCRTGLEWQRDKLIETH